MARKASKNTPAEAPQIDEQGISDDLAAMDARTVDLIEIDKVYGEGLPYAKDRVIAEAQFFIRQGSESFFEAGKRLVLLKEHEGHGGFLGALEAVGIEARAAQRLMLVAAKFSNTTTLSYLPRSKMMELAVLDDDQIEALDKGGTVAGLQVDEIDRLSVRELRARLREEMAEHEATREQISKKDEKLNELDKKLTKNNRQPWDAKVMEALATHINGTEMVMEFVTDYQKSLEGLAEMLDSPDTTEEQRESAARSLVAEVNKLFTACNKIVATCNDRISHFIIQ